MNYPFGICSAKKMHLRQISIAVMRKPMSLTKYWFLLAFSFLLTVTPPVQAINVLTYEQARQILATQSDAIQAANYQVDSARDKKSSLDRLHLPTLSISAGIQAYQLQRSLNIEPLQQGLGQIIAGAGQLIPNSINLKFDGINPSAALTSSWLLYTGGRTSATRLYADAEIAQAKAERSSTVEQQEKLLATVYFGHLLTQNILTIREDVLKGIRRHLQLATRFEAEGVLSKVERLHAQVAFDEARRNLEQAKADFGIADLTLQRLLRSEKSVNPSTQLFVIKAYISPVSEFLDAGLSGHSQLALVRAKIKQAEQGKVIEEARYKPTVVAYGSYNMVQENADFSNPLPLLEPDWVVGINISVPLFDRYNRSRLVSAAQKQVLRAEALEREIKTGLATYIEKSYRSVERARQQFLLLESNIELAKETLTLRDRLFEEGLGTSLDVVDARLAVAQAETERAVAAYAFVVSLVDLLEASGQIELFNDYIALADIRLSIKEEVQ